MGPSSGEALLVVVVLVVVAAVSVSERARFSVGLSPGSSTSTAEDARTRASMLSDDDTGSSRDDAEPILREQSSPGHYHLTPVKRGRTRTSLETASGGKLEICNCCCCGAGRASLLKLKRERIFDLQSSRERDRTPGHR